jgi:hypothetical protein
MWRVRIAGDCAAWALVPTDAGRAALRARMETVSGDAAVTEHTP